MLDDSDVHHRRHAKAAVGGVAATAIGDPAVFVSVDAMHQGPQGGGPVIAIIDAGEKGRRHQACLVCGAPRYRGSQITRDPLHLSVETVAISRKVYLTKSLQHFWRSV